MQPEEFPNILCYPALFSFVTGLNCSNCVKWVDQTKTVSVCFSEDVNAVVVVIVVVVVDCNLCSQTSLFIVAVLFHA